MNCFMNWKNCSFTSRFLGCFLTVGCLLGVGAIARAQSPDTAVVFKAMFLKHEYQPYQLIHTNYRLSGVDTVELERFVLKADIYVVDSSENQYLLEWRIKNQSISTDSRMVQQLFNLSKPAKVSVRTAASGELTDFLNWREVTKSYDEAFRTLLPDLTRQNDSLSAGTVSRLYALRQTWETSVLRSIRLFHQAYGRIYRPGEMVQMPDSVEGLGTASYVTGQSRKKLIQLDRESGMAVLVSVFVPDQSSLSFSSVTGSMVVDTHTGWILYAFEQREGKLPDGSMAGDLLEIKHESISYNP